MLEVFKKLHSSDCCQHGQKCFRVVAWAMKFVFQQTDTCHTPRMYLDSFYVHGIFTKCL